jgi:hypothetical protein
MLVLQFLLFVLHQVNIDGYECNVWLQKTIL